MKKHKTIGKVLSLLLALSLLFQPITGLAKKEEKTTKKSDIVIDVLEFGADPTGINDSAEAIWNALEEAKKVSDGGKKSVTLNFPKGEFTFTKTRRSRESIIHRTQIVSRTQSRPSEF